jgi:hypothetical protein
MLKTTLLNGITNERDKDYTALGLQSIRPGVIGGLEVTTNSISAGTGFIKCTRTAITPNEDILVLVTLTASEVIDTTGTKKFWIVIDQNNINDPALNDVNGTLAGKIDSGASYPAGNYIPLADVVGGVITDEREVATLKATNLSGAEIYLEANAGGTKILFKDISGDIVDLEGENLYAVTDIFINGVGTDQPLGIPLLGADGKIKPGQIPDSPVQTEKIDLLNLTPGETLGDGIYIFRKGYKVGEDTGRLYNYQDGDEGEKLGVYEGTTNGYEDPLTTNTGTNLEVYGVNLYGGVIQHSQNSIIKLEDLTIDTRGSGTYDFKIYPFDGGNNVDTGNPLLEMDGIAFANNADIPNTSPGSIGLNGTFQVISGSSFVASANGDYSYQITKDASINRDVVYQLHADGVPIGTPNDTGSGTNPETDTTTATVTAGQTIDLRVKTNDLGHTPVFSNMTGFPAVYQQITEITFTGPVAITPATDYAFVFVVSGGDANNKLLIDGDLVTDTKLVSSTSGLGGLGTPVTGGIKNKLISDVAISTINLINFGVFEPIDPILDNTRYYVDGAGAITTTEASNTLLGDSFTDSKILTKLQEEGEETVDFLNFTTPGSGASYSTVYNHNLGRIPVKFEAFCSRYGTAGYPSHGWLEQGQYACVGPE